MIKKHIMKVLCLVLILALFSSLTTTVYAGTSDTTCSCSPIQSALVKYVQNHNNMIAKAIVRSQFRAAANAGAAVGCTTAATMLKHSLQYRPKDLTFGDSSKYARQIKNSPEYKAIVNDLKTQFNDADNDGTKQITGSCSFSSSLDLYLSYHGMNYEATGTKENGKLVISVTFSDTYDFNCMEWGRSLSLSSVVAAINNYAVYAQKMKAIVPYEISVTVNTVV